MVRYMVEISPKSYYYNSIIQLHVSWIKTYKNIQVELHKMSKGYLVLIGFNVFTEKSGDWIDRVEVVKTNRKYLLVVIKEPLGFRIPKNGELNPDAEPDIVKLESDIIVYLPLPNDAYKVDKWRVGRGFIEVRISRFEVGGL